MTRETSPPLFNVVATGVPAAVTLVGVTGTDAGLLAGLVGVVVTIVGVTRTSRYLLGIGIVALFSAVVLTGAMGRQPSVLAVGAVAALVTWDVGDHVIGLASHLGRRADQRRLVVTHAVWSVISATVALVIVVLTFSMVPRQYPVLVVVLLLGGSLALVAAIRLGR